MVLYHPGGEDFSDSTIATQQYRIQPSPKVKLRMFLLMYRFIRMKCMIQSNARNSISILGVLGWSNLAQYQEWRLSVVPVILVLQQPRVVKNNFQEKELPYHCSTLAFVRLFVAAAATVHQGTHFWRLETFCICLTKNFSFLNPLQRMIQSNSIPGILGWSNLMHAHSNYLICINLG